MKTFKTFALAALAALVLIPAAHSENTIPLKPDSANAAVAIAHGSTVNAFEATRLYFTKTAIGSASGQNTGVNVSTVIAVTTSYETVISSGGPIVLTSIPTIATGPAAGLEFASGTILVIASTATASVTFQDNGTLSGSQLELGSTTRAISANKTLTLIYDATLHRWLELAFGSN